MKILLALLFFIMVSATCNRTINTTTAETRNSTCYKARLELKGICMNYVIKVLEGDTTKLNLEPEWKDETDGKVYNNVFALGSVCSFPDLEEGAEFYFTLSEKEDTGCNVCMAYRPVPATKNNIVVHQTACP